MDTPIEYSYFSACGFFNVALLYPESIRVESLIDPAWRFAS
jgi:hypothetical protein